MAVKVRNTVVNGGLSGISKEISKVFSYKQGQNHSIMKKAGAVNDKKSAAQLAVRSMFTQTSAGWSGLTEVQRSLWNAEAPNWTNTGIYGDTKPSGKNLYTACNVALMSAGKTDVITEPANKAMIAVIDSAKLVADTAGGINLTIGFSTTSPDDYVVVAVSGQKSAGTSKADAKTILFSAIADTGVSANLKSAFESKYGTQVAGKKMFFEIRTVSSGGYSTKYKEGHIVF